ncbi:MAG: AAA ATPase [Candidatus Peregrinibacteria bacterium GW2011_GWF2_33_10]|nr:MAG: AAA ATPase [Candidatus Peregrinibacteria bacterium GW2011_GWF2_33_10]OGJ44709.1 MAG: hypothetical protein A2272_02435 [Candidatus Peregrinibacteria bacterium RIFOXYA12_FULL_33_12]OGJ46226.1 MAG: hypothetical protein A2263_05065 [Candidatus Peregrinibacteria bacterium RIFOXYA2_FULL_33_21]OGJ51642.1 MAG: hypothetical protein A2307_04235 [Candidatus Peregrinibacteria bacterium RIFOXYB2_FULL_33_20]
MFNRKIITYLSSWKDNVDRKPLILRGARQVGKTSIVKYFAKKYFHNFVYINLEDFKDLDAFSGNMSIEEFEKKVKIFKKQNLSKGTLVFIDEIQNNPYLIALLRFFYEERPDLYIIGAGSLLEIKIKQQKLSMPVGRVEYMFMYPLDFFEFLEAKEEISLLDYLKTIDFEKPIPYSIHKKALDIFSEYIFVGGMPEVVKVFLAKNNFDSVRHAYGNLLQNFIDDIDKYTDKNESSNLINIFKNAPFYSGSKIVFENFANLGLKSKSVSDAFQILQDTMLVSLINSTNSLSLPLQSKSKRAKKLIFLDSGFYNYAYNIPFDLDISRFADFYKGNIFEQILAQNIIAQDIYGDKDLFYWSIDKDKGSLEIDFCFSSGVNIYGIEVKSGVDKVSKSLVSFANRIKHKKLIKFHTGNILLDRKNQILSLPIYLCPRIYEL